MVPLLSCNLIDVTGDEDARSGRGAKLHDPYQSLDSGSVRLSLQYYNGCAYLPTGQTVAKNATPVPYPDLCATPLNPLDPVAFKTPPTGTLKLMTKTPYFLNQFTVTDTVVNAHKGAQGMTDALNWIRTQSWMKKLDWNGVGASPEEWIFTAELKGITKDAWAREVFFRGANWEKVENDTFTVEILDRDAVSRTTVVYNRSELLVASPYSGHSRVSYRVENVQPPRYSGDTELQPLASRPTDFPQPITYRTLARMDLMGSTNPFKTFTTPDLPGEGALKITWSQLPNDPFYFPVTFVERESLEDSCLTEDGKPTKCDFGVDPRLAISPPADGSDIYKPGETISVRVDIRDSEGNRLLKVPELYPSMKDITTNNANGLLNIIANHYLSTFEADASSVFSVAGPLQDLKVPSNPVEPRTYFTFFPYITEPTATLRLVPSIFTVPWPTEFKVTLPMDAKPGTYVAYSKSTRYFLGERVTKTRPFFFQVGKPAETTYPGRVGNCQICHRGTLSLDNLRHGIPVDHVEGCKTCHFSENDTTARAQDFVHKIHMNSPRYSLPKNDCTMCHLTREGATRPSLQTCGTCHPSVHGDKYFQTQFSNKGEPNRFGNCAQSCHGDQPPQSHILPEN
jgi:hypothetical protein